MKMRQRLHFGGDFHENTAARRGLHFRLDDARRAAISRIGRAPKQPPGYRAAR